MSESSPPPAAGETPALIPSATPAENTRATPQPPVAAFSPEAAPSEAIPPILAPANEPPVLPPPTPAKPPGLSATLQLALVGAFLYLAVVAFIHTGYGKDTSAPFRIGSFVGMVAFWPAVILGLFSIGRRFRTPRARAQILLFTWGVCIMGLLASINLQTRVKRASVEARGFSAETSANAETPNTTKQKSSRTPVPSLRPDAPLAYDFSRGSDERLIKSIETAQEDRYRSIAAEYARACEMRPSDAVLALERVRFIEKFAYAEDITIDGADDDHDAAVAYLTSRFPNAPGTVLYEMNRAYGPKFEAKAKAHAAQVRSWPPQDQAQFYLLRAEQENDEPRKRVLANLSFEAKATVEAGLMLLELDTKPEQRASTLKLLEHPIFETAESHQKKQVMDFLFSAGQHARALALYQQIKEQAAPLVENAKTAEQIAATGDVVTGRSIMAAIPLHDWNRESLQRARFEFELKYGNAEQAAARYRTLLTTGFAADPLLRDRAALFLKYPTAGWSGHDLLGALLLALTLALLALLPAVLLLPAHYWSMLRADRGKLSPWPEARWKLRDAWIGLAALFCIEFTIIWAMQPVVMRSWWNDRPMHRELAAAAEASVLPQQLVTWAAMAAVLAFLLWRTRAWRVLGRGNWSWGTAIGQGLATVLVARIALLTYTAIWPESIEGQMASLSPTTLKLCHELLEHTGPAGLILAVAVLVPILEELLFRGVLLHALARHIPFGWANLAQAMLFAAVHENLLIFPFFVVFGLLCGALARRSDGLFASMVLHAINNFLACLVIIRTGI